MVTLFTFRFRLFHSISDYRNGNKAKDINASDVFKEKNLLILGENVNGVEGMLYKLYEISKKGISESFIFQHFNYEEISGRLKNSRRESPTYIFIDNFFERVDLAVQLDIKRIYELRETYPTALFFTAITYESLKRNSFLYYSSDYKVAELIPILSIEENVAPAEEVQQKKSEPVKEIKQEKAEPQPIFRQARRSKTRPKQFEPTRTRYDEIFRKVINGPDFDALRNAPDFLLLRQQNNLKLFSMLQNVVKKNPDYKNRAKAMETKLSASTLDVDQFGRDFPDDEIWIAVMLVVNDLSFAHFFIEGGELTEKPPEKFYPKLEREWAIGLLRFLTSDNDVVNNATLINYFNFYESPSSNAYIFDVSVKQKIIAAIFETEYKSDQFSPLLWGYFESLSQNNPKNAENLGIFVAAVLLHPEIKAIWNVEPQEKTPPPPAFNDGNTIPKISTDEASEIDHLDFKHDVHALAALIAYDKTPLPLAIGLFGNWGSGKSSFMKQLENRVDYLSTDQYKNLKLVDASKDEMPYCTNITHITFNAWHYSDGNLWASMMVHIFDELLEKIAASKTREELRAELLKNLSTASEAVLEAEKRVSESTARLTVARTTLKTIEDQRAGIDGELARVQLSLRDVFGTLMKDAQFNSTLQQFVKESGYNKLIENKQQLEAWKTEMDSFGERILKAYKNIYKANKLFAIVLIVLPAMVSWLFYYLYTNGTLENISAVIAAATVSVIPFLGRMMNQVRKINKSLLRVESLQKEKTNKKEIELKEREKIITEEIKHHIATVEEQKKQVEAAKKEEADAKAALEAIDINRQLTNFIQQRQAGNNYQQHLGIISLIRKDFNELRKFLKASNKEKKPKERIIERIVLYIDDLDRCKTDRVVAVLEAVHLLLAFDLFVVVVGVDPRWVSKALKEQYKEQLHLDAEEDSDTSNLPGQRATPFDYLEKIFQVPFVLRPMDNSGAKKLLDNLFKGQVKQKEEEKTSDPGLLPDALYIKSETGDVLVEDPFLHLSEDQAQALRNKLVVDNAEAQKKKEDEEAAKKEFIEQVENLSISGDELTFMKSIAPIIGATPRTVKRYGNLYRLLRVHSDLPNYSTENLPIYQAVMLLLSISVSNGSIARPFFAALKESKKAGFFDLNVDLIATLTRQASDANKKDEKEEEEKEKADSLSEQLQALNQLHNELGKLPDEIKNFSVATLKKHSHVVSRFSFRTLNCVEEEAIPAKA
jgi:hypothetical protein